MHATAPLHATNPQAAARLLELIQMRLISEAIHVVAALGIADLLANGPRGIDQLAEAAGASTLPLGRVMRALSSFGVFLEEMPGRFAMGPLGELLRRDAEGSLYSAALFFGGEAGASVIELFEHCVRTGESAGQKLSGAINCFDWMLSDPERAQLFNATMTAFSTLHMTGVLDVYDFASATKIVDVGGGHGRIIADILKRNPGMHGVLFDLPHALAGGQSTIAHAGLEDRCEVISGDFFASVPAGGNTYLLSRVIHDWDDEKATTILKNVRRAIAANGKLVLLETMLRPAATTVYPELSDLNMLLMTGGCERTEAQYRAIYGAAGFELIQTVETKSPTGTTVIEGKPI
ncbi:acetylserotonin O-methyltransferase [Paraburkholderia sp. HD33-4]|uniref:acetylserotonin O-methyltransferase n=1 Tax=Paraburkholderia sp. HD33-4 TaxID=2883242 RepID=UPI001F2C17A5|nr:acetylserotonin O-methyltransferase [Paraburkholderia sp. HD33-4]